MSHPEQRFRLSYLLGQFRSSEKPITIEKIGNQESSLDVPYPDQNILQSDLMYILNEIKLLSNEAQITFPITDDDDNVDEVITLIYEEWIKEETERFNDLVNYILQLIKKRFTAIKYGLFHKDNRGWPDYWYHDSKDKLEVIKMMRWFAGNEGRRFGELLAPVVNGIRLEGPFKPSWWKNHIPPKLVLIDGEGIGHDSNITTSIPMDVTTRFKEMDTIILVDNASQPMLEAPKIILSEAMARGQLEKLMIAYTRFDQVHGTNMIDEEDRFNHITGIQAGAIEGIQEANNLNPKLIRQLRNHLEDFTFFFSQTHELQNIPEDLKDEMDRFIESIIQNTKKASINNIDRSKVFPEYDFGTLVLTIEQTHQLFMNKWLSLIGIEIKTSQYQPQHWMRIKALSNRFANWPNCVEYNDLKPASDLASYLMQRINEFINSPRSWSIDVDDGEKIKILQSISEFVSDRINELIFNRIKILNQEKWIKAYNFRGAGSTKDRRTEIRSIFEETIPQPNIRFNTVSSELLNDIKKIIDEAIDFRKGKSVSNYEINPLHFGL